MGELPCGTSALVVVEIMDLLLTVIMLTIILGLWKYFYPSKIQVLEHVGKSTIIGILLQLC